MSDYPYPVLTDLKAGYTILNLAFRHQIQDLNLNQFRAGLQELNWGYHDFLSNGPRSVRAFRPQDILTPVALESCFGENLAAIQNDPAKEIEKFFTKIDGKKKPPLRNFALTLQDVALENLKKLSISPDPRNPNYQINFAIEWVDYWVFSDQIGIISIKVQPTSVMGKDNPELTLTDFAAFNRTARIFSNQIGVEVVQSHSNGTEESKCLWRDLIVGELLGQGGSAPLTGVEAPPDIFLDNYVDNHAKYSKLLTFAEIPNLEPAPGHEHRSEEELSFLWNAPTVDPAPNFEKHYTEILQGKRPDLFTAYSNATSHGYPTLGDYVLYDLASCGNSGDAMGANGSALWQVSPEYLRELFGESSIEIWEAWRGLALHDTLAFLSTDSAMPIKWQAESRYSFLYIYLYHAQYNLHVLSREIIDSELSDLSKARRINDRFNKFRNQYWFRGVTVDFQGLIITDATKTALKMDDIFDTVSAEISEVTEFIDDKIAKGKEALFAMVVAALYPVTYIYEIMGVGRYFDSLGEKNPLLGIVSVVLVTGIIFYMGVRFLPQIKRSINRLFEKFY